MIVGYLESKAERVRARRTGNADRRGRAEKLRSLVETLPPPSPFATRLRAGDTIALIAEFKRRSPSAGPLADAEEIVDAVTLYRQCGASALSILTDAEDFDGSLGDLERVTRDSAMPVLRKDFLVDELDLLEARNAGAAAALLIVRLLHPDELQAMLELGRSLALDCVVEVHDEDELRSALDVGATVIGINNRDLNSLTTNLRVTERLSALVTSDVTVVSESGIRTAEDVARVRNAGAHAVLVGESLLRLEPARRRALTVELAGVAR